MISFFKKRIGSLITSNLAYNTIVKKGIRNGFLKTSSGYIFVKGQSHYLQSLIFWGVYEKAEITLIRKYLKKDLHVIELGASLGMTTCTICSSVNKNCRVVSVEANPLLNGSLLITKAKNGFENLSIVSAAIDYSDNSFVGFYQDDRNLGSHKSDNIQAIKVPTIKLSEIKKQYSLSDFCLVSDIEGAELEMFCSENDPETIEGCKQIIIELHGASYKGRKYLPSDMSILISKKFKMKIKYSFQNTWVFERN